MLLRSRRIRGILWLFSGIVQTYFSGSSTFEERFTTHYPEGVAWITVAEPPGIATNNCCIMFIDEDIFLVNTEGEAIWSMQDDGIKYFEEIYGSDSVESLYLSYGTGNSYTSREEFNGYFEIRAKINTFEQTGNFITIINPDATPLFEPSRNVRNLISIKMKNCVP